MMNSMHLYSILFILSIIYPCSESFNVKRNVRVRRAEPAFLETKCTLIDSVSKERCSTSTSEDSSGRVSQSHWCVFDEKFRVSYQTQKGQKIISTTETFGHTFPRLMKAGDYDKCYYHPTNVRTVRWTLKEESNVLSLIIGLIITGATFIIFGLFFVGRAIYKKSKC